MRRVLYFFISISFVFIGRMNAQQFSVGDTATFKYYDAGFFSGFYTAKYLCRAVTDNAYIFSEEVPYQITKVYVGNGQVIVFDPAKKYYRKLNDNDVFSIFGYSEDTTSLIYNLNHTGKAAIKLLRTGGIQFYTVTTQGLYLYNVSNWSLRLPRRDLVDVAVSPKVPTSIIGYFPYFLAKYSILTTLRTPLGRVIKLPHDLFIDDGFEPDYSEDTLLTDWTTSGNVSVVRSILISIPHYLMHLSGNASASKSFSLPATMFKFEITPVITRNTPDGVVSFEDQSGTSAFSLTFLGDSLFLNGNNLGEFQPYSVQKIEGVVNINDGLLQIYLNDSLVYDDSNYTFDVSQVSKLQISLNSGELFLDDIAAQPIVYTIVGHHSNKNAFYLGAADGLYLYNSGTWSKIYDGNVRIVRPVSDNTVYILSDNLILKTEDGGASWDTLPSTTLDSVYDFAVNPDNTDLLVAVGVPGIVKFADGSWQNISDSLLNWSPPEFVDTIYSVGYLDDSTIVIGTGQGVFMSEGTIENLVEKNKGILKSFITNDGVQLLAQYVDSAYTTMNTFFDGLARDVDNDPRVYVLAGDLSAKLTSGETKIIPILGVMNPELNYVEDANHPHGDGHEIIEIDVYDDSLNQYVSSAYETWKYATYRAMAKLFFWTHDTKEENWLIEGIGGLGEYLAKYNPGDPDTAEYELSPLYSLKKILVTPYKVDQYVASLNRPYLFLLHLWAKYGIQTLQSIYSDATIPSSVVGLARIARITGVDQNDLYKEWILDVFKHENMDLTPNLNVNLIERLFPPYYSTIQSLSDWSFGGFQIVLTQNDTLNYLRFNGVNINDSSEFDVYYGISGGTLHHVTDWGANGDRVITGLTNTQDTTVYNFIVFFADSQLSDNTALSYAVKKDTIPPTVDVGYFQNSLADRNINVYLFTNERLFDEVIDTIPSLYLISGLDTTTADLSIFDSYNDTIIYSSNFTLSSTGKIYLKASLQDFAGNAVEISDSVLAWYLQSGSKLTFTGFDGEILLEIPENAISVGGYAIYSISNGGFYKVSNPVYVFPNVQLKSPARVELNLPNDGKKDYHVYVWYKGTWHDAGGMLTPSGDRIVAYINTLGPLTLMQTNGIIPRRFAFKLLGSPVILSKKVSFEVSVPHPTKLSVKVYNLSGREVAKLFDGNISSGKYNFSWRVESLRNGVYFIVVKDLRSGVRFSKKVVKF